jgi:hypothetical protein
MPEHVVIDELTYEKAERLAIATLKVFQRTRGHYNNTLNSHLRGKIGELACVQWLSREGISCEAIFEYLDRIAEADLVLGESRFDVKTWDERYWNEMGRCIAVNQLPKLKAKADGVVWCTSPAKLEPGITVEILAWSTIDDIETAPKRMTGPAHRRQVYNHQLDPQTLRPLDTLLASASS